MKTKHRILAVIICCPLLLAGCGDDNPVSGLFTSGPEIDQKPDPGNDNLKGQTIQQVADKLMALGMCDVDNLWVSPTQGIEDDHEDFAGCQGEGADKYRLNGFGAYRYTSFTSFEQFRDEKVSDRTTEIDIADISPNTCPDHKTDGEMGPRVGKVDTLGGTLFATDGEIFWQISFGVSILDLNSTEKLFEQFRERSQKLVDTFGGSVWCN